MARHENRDAELPVRQQLLTVLRETLAAARRVVAEDELWLVGAASADSTVTVTDILGTDEGWQASAEADWQEQIEQADWIEVDGRRWHRPEDADALEGIRERSHRREADRIAAGRERLRDFDEEWAYNAARRRLEGTKLQIQKTEQEMQAGTIGLTEATRRLRRLRAEKEEVRKRVEEYEAGHASPDDTENPEELAGATASIFRRTATGWEISFDGGALFRVGDTNGARAAAYLIDSWAHPPYPDARCPQGGAAEVYEWVCGGQVGQSASHDDPNDTYRAITTDRARLAEIKKRREEIDSESLSPSLAEDREQQLAEEDDLLAREAEQIEADLNSKTNRQGQPRKPRPPGVDAVDSALTRFKKEMASKDLKLHDHLKNALKGGSSPRYSPDAEVPWEVSLHP